MKIAVWHNVFWSRYKAVVFSALYRQSVSKGISASFYQIAETEANRVGLSPVDRSVHQYPFALLFPGEAYSKIPLLRRMFKMSWCAYKDDADITILCGYERPEVWLQALVLSIRRKRFAVFCDSTLYDRRQIFLKGVLKRLFFGWCDGIFCYGKRAMEYVLYYGAAPSSVFVRCQAAALPNDYSPEVALQDRAINAPKDGSVRYLYVGRLSREKSLDHLLVAFQEVAASNPKSELILIGSGPQLGSLQTLAIQLGIQDKVVLLGSKSGAELYDEYSRASCLVLPSESEPWGLVVNEALSYGCPVIVSAHCGCIPELVHEGRTGFSFEWGNVEHLVQRMNAVPDAFADIAATAQACLQQVAPYSPEAAAKSILDGCRVIYNSQKVRI